jgi:hypothetical protein
MDDLVGWSGLTGLVSSDSARRVVRRESECFQHAVQVGHGEFDVVVLALSGA